MATTLMYKCKCGIMYSVYVSKKAIATYMGMSRDEVEAAGARDRETDRDGEIAVASRIARMTKIQFIDFRRSDEFLCSCKRKIDLGEVMENFCRA